MSAIREMFFIAAQSRLIALRKVKLAAFITPFH